MRSEFGRAAGERLARQAQQLTRLSDRESPPTEQLHDEGFARGHLDGVVLCGQDRCEIIVERQRFHWTSPQVSVAPRAGPSMYQIERPAQVQASKAFTSRSLVLLILVVFFGTPFVLALGCLAHHPMCAEWLSRMMRIVTPGG